MNAETAHPDSLNCPTCGASLSSDETTCRYCGTRLKTIACPNCFGMMFVGSKFCPHCGASAAPPVDEGPALDCPQCRAPMERVALKQVPLQECRRCYGIWLDSKSFERICADRGRQADVLDAILAPPQHVPVTTSVRYRPCPQCGKLMNRCNFAQVSEIVIDECKWHGVWFDRNELQQIVDFLRTGGTELADFRAWRSQTEKARWLAAQQRAANLEKSLFARDDDTTGHVFHAMGHIVGRLMERR